MTPTEIEAAYTYSSNRSEDLARASDAAAKERMLKRMVDRVTDGQIGREFLQQIADGTANIRTADERDTTSVLVLMGHQYGITVGAMARRILTDIADGKGRSLRESGWTMRQELDKRRAANS